MVVNIGIIHILADCCFLPISLNGNKFTIQLTVQVNIMEHATFENHWTKKCTNLSSAAALSHLRKHLLLQMILT